jgi:thiol-disulfide isomerase/thioredoxin
MKGKRFAIAGVLAVLAAAGLTTVTGCSSDDSGDKAPVAESTEQSGGVYGSDRSPGGENAAAEGQADNAGAGSAAAQPGQYVDYSPELVSSTPGEKLLFFHAPWCSQCQALEEDIEASGVPDGVTIFKVDYDSNQDLRQQYGVTIQTTMVKVDDNGDEIESYVAYEDPTLDNVSAALLNQ